MEEVSEQELRERAALVAQLGLALNSKDVSLDAILSMIKLVIKEKAWTHFKTKTDEEVTYKDTPEDYRKFILTPRVTGLGTTPEVIERNIKDDEEAFRLHRDLMKLPEGNTTGTTTNIISSSTSRNTIHGTSKGYGLEVLHDKHPEMYERVLHGEISVNKALIQVGERKPTATIPLHSMPRLAASLKRRLNEQDRLELIRLLTSNEHNAE